MAMASARMLQAPKSRTTRCESRAGARGHDGKGREDAIETAEDYRLQLAADFRMGLVVAAVHSTRVGSRDASTSSAE